MIYNFNLGIGWASSGVEYAQSYRGKVFRNLGVDAKFVFTDMFPRENIEHMTANLDFPDEEIIWLYTFFTDTQIAPVSFTMADLEKTFGNQKFTRKEEEDTVRYHFEGDGNFCTAYRVKAGSNLIHRVELVSDGCLVRKDYYTYCKLYSEYYAPLDGKAHLYQRRFYNENGSTAYEEIIDDDDVMYQFPDKILGSKEEFVGYMVSQMGLTEKDIVIIDRTTGVGQSIMQNAKPAKVGIVIHADHFSEGSTNDNYSLWNNYYEYSFSQTKHIDFYITATQAQNDLLKEHFKKYHQVEPKIVTIPVGAIAELKVPTEPRKPFSLITASRLASEKHVDWLVEAVAIAKKKIPGVTLDIYGKGGEEEKIKALIEKNNCEDCIRLMGQQKLDEVYQNYEAYIAGSTSEGFGLTLLEAVGSGLPIIGFDVRYGNQTFVWTDKNGYRLDYHDEQTIPDRILNLSDAIVKLFVQADMEEFQQYSYNLAKQYLSQEVEKKWNNLITELI